MTNSKPYLNTISSQAFSVAGFDMDMTLNQQPTTKKLYPRSGAKKIECKTYLRQQLSYTIFDNYLRLILVKCLKLIFLGKILPKTYKIVLEGQFITSNKKF